MTTRHATFITVLITAVVTAGMTLAAIYFWPGQPTFHFQSATATLGDTVMIDRVALRALDAKRTPGASPIVAPADHVYLVTTVFLGNNTGHTIQVIPLLHFHAKDDRGRVYDVTTNPSGSTQLSGPLLDGDSLQEELSFLIPSDARGLHLIFEPGIETPSVARIALERP